MSTVSHDRCVRPRTIPHDWTPLDDPATRRLAEACLLRGHGRYSVADVAQALGMCADTLCAILGIQADA